MALFTAEATEIFGSAKPWLNDFGNPQGWYFAPRAGFTERYRKQWAGVSSIAQEISKPARAPRMEQSAVGSTNGRTSGGGSRPRPEAKLLLRSCAREVGQKQPHRD